MSSFLDGPNTGGFAKNKNKGNSYRQLRGETEPKLSHKHITKSYLWTSKWFIYSIWLNLDAKDALIYILITNKTQIS